MKTRLVAIAAAPLLLLTACEDEAAGDGSTAETGGEAAGEVLGGTISDDMIALEELTSTSPPARPSPSEGATGGAPDAQSEDSAETEEAGTSEEAPAPEADADATGEE